MKPWHKTRFRGVRYRESSIKKHNNKPDCSYYVRYRYDGKYYEELAGWQSEGFTAGQAFDILMELKRNQRRSEGFMTLKQKNELKKEKDEAEQARKKQKALNRITFGDVFEKYYVPQCKADGKVSIVREQSLFKEWLNPLLGGIPLVELSPLDLERLKNKMKKKGRAPRSIEYGLSVVRRVLNFAKNIDLFFGESPTKKVKWPKFDNLRRRFLSKQEADMLLESLKAADEEIWAQAIISLHCGLRASEIFALKWIDVNPKDKTILVKDSKGHTRVAHMTEEVGQLFLSKKAGKPDDLIFPGPVGKQRHEVSHTFKRIVKELGLNDGITDRRQKIVFHSLRHTFASWLLESGEDIYVIQKMGGWRTLSMSTRYTHIFDHRRKRAVQSLEKFLKKKPDKPESKVVPLQEK